MRHKLEIQEKSRLGTLLVHRGLITRQQLDEALIAQACGRKLGEVLIERQLITQKQLNKILRGQSRYRMIAAFSAMLLAPLQPFVATAVHADETHVVTSQEYMNRGISQLTDNELADVSGQRSLNSYERLLDIVNSDLQAEDQLNAALANLSKTLFPGSVISAANIKVSGAEYDPGPRTTINQDGSLDVQLPNKIRQVTFSNVTIDGSEGQHFADVIVKDISFGENASVKIYLR